MLFSITSISKPSRVNISQLTRRLRIFGENTDNWEMSDCNL